jgi:hypothetical protein
VNQIADLISFVVRPVIMVAVAAPIYKLSKLFVVPKKAAMTSLALTTLLFISELFSIQYLGLRLAMAISTLVGFTLLAFIFWKRVSSRE